MKKSGFKFDKEKLLSALSKRAEGFFYSEEILEYGEKQEKSVKAKKEDCDSVMEDGEDLGAHEENFENCVSKKLKNQKHDLYSRCNREDGADKTSDPNMKGDVPQNENLQGLVLLKKKVTTHYIPPDLAAVKMLIEIAGEEMKRGNDFLDGMSDEELLKLKKELMSELKE